MPPVSHTRTPISPTGWDHWPSAGVYQLWIIVSRECRCRIGGLGSQCFPRGLYVYTGRASRSLVARVTRHLCGSPRRHWHIDHLLAQPTVRIGRVTLASQEAADECRVNQRTGGEVIVPGFGASDCRSGCGSHLLRVARTAALPPMNPQTM